MLKKYELVAWVNRFPVGTTRLGSLGKPLFEREKVIYSRDRLKKLWKKMIYSRDRLAFYGKKIEEM